MIREPEYVEVQATCSKCGATFPAFILSCRINSQKLWPHTCIECKKKRQRKNNQAHLARDRAKNAAEKEASSLKSTHYKRLKVETKKKARHVHGANLQISKTDFDRKYRRFCKLHNMKKEIEELKPEISKSHFLQDKKAAAERFAELSNRFVNSAEIEAARRARYQARKLKEKEKAQ